MLGLGVVLQVPDQVAAEVADIGLEFPDVVPETVQFGHNDLVTVRAAVAVAPADYGPGHNDDQDADGSDDLGQASEVIHLRVSFQGQHFIHFLPAQVLGCGEFGLEQSQKFRVICGNVRYWTVNHHVGRPIIFQSCRALNHK